MPLRGALRQAVTDFYFNSWRLAPANLVWGAGFVAFLVAGPLTVLGVALLVLLAVPVAGLHRMAALIARGEPAGFADFVGGMRRHAAAAVTVAAGAAILALVFTTNVLVGLQAGGPLAWLLSALALWGDVALATWLVAFWPILADPEREAVGLRRKIALAGLVVVGRPGRTFLLAALVWAILAISVVLFAAILLVSVAYVSLVSARYVLPMADEVERQVAAHRAG